MTEDDSGFKSIFTGGWILFFGLALELVISLVGKILIARYLGKFSYGGVSLGATLLAVTSTMVLAGIHTGVGRFLPRFDSSEDKNGLLWSSFLIVGSLSIATAIAMVISASWIAENIFNNPDLAPLITVFALAVPAAALMRLAIGITQGYHLSIPKVAIRNFAFPITRLLGIGIVVVLGAGALGIAGAYVAAYVFAACVGLVYIYTKTDFEWSIPEETHIRELTSFSAPLFITGALTLILSDIDTLMLGAFSTQSDVGVYNVVYPTAILLLVSLRSFRFLYMPRISELDSNDNTEAIRSNYRLITKWLYFTTTPILLVFLIRSETIITLLYGAEYASGSLVLGILAVGFYLHSVLGLNGTTLTSLGRTRTILYVNLVAAAINIVLNLILIPRYSIVGAAIATTVSYILINIFYSLTLYSATGISPIQKPILLFSVVLSGFALPLYHLSSGINEVLFWLLLCPFFIIYTAMFVYVVGITTEEKQIGVRILQSTAFGEKWVPVIMKRFGK